MNGREFDLRSLINLPTIPRSAESSFHMMVIKEEESIQFENIMVYRPVVTDQIERFLLGLWALDHVFIRLATF